MKLVLASQSPRRRELLGQMGLTFDVQSPEVEESAFSGSSAEELVKILSREKAQEVSRRQDGETIVIGADTVVVLGEEILGKPHTPEEAAAMLRKLSGKTHRVCTGVTVVQGVRVVSEAVETSVTFRTLTEREITAYVDSGEPMDKAGAYGIQGLGAMLVEGIRGDYNNVVGLPICALYRVLIGFGLDCLAGKRPS